jgi:hypothetical protein
MGHGQTENEPGRHRCSASDETPTSDRPRRSDNFRQCDHGRGMAIASPTQQKLSKNQVNYLHRRLC